MAGTAPLLDTPLSRVEKAPRAPSPSSSKPAQDSFERVQKEVAQAGRKDADSSQTGRRDVAPGEKGKPQSDGAADASQPAPQSAATDNAAATAPAPVSPDESADTTISAMPEEFPDGEEGIFALALPVSEPVQRGNSLPLTPATSAAPVAGLAPAAEGPAEAVGLRQLFTQMQQGGAGGKAGTAQEGLGKGSANVELEGFKSSLAEAIDGRGGRSSDAPPVTLMTSQRGAEIREGSALIRQYSTTVDTPVQQQGEWGDKMAGKISWLANQRISFAEIHINPPDMGPVEVRVSVQNDQASVAVHAQNASVRDLLELNSQRLRDMMQDNGLNLAKMDVSDQPSRQQQNTAGGESGQGDENAQETADDSGMISVDGEAVSTGEVHMQWQSQVDTYA